MCFWLPGFHLKTPNKHPLLHLQGVPGTSANEHVGICAGRGLNLQAMDRRGRSFYGQKTNTYVNVVYTNV